MFRCIPLSHIDIFFNWYHIVLICITYTQGKLNIFSIYRFMLSVFHIKVIDLSLVCSTRVQYELRIFFYFYTLHIMRYVIRVQSSLFHVMHVCRGVNFTSLCFTYIAYKSPYCLIYFRPFVDDLTKRGRRILKFYIYV